MLKRIIIGLIVFIAGAVTGGVAVGTAMRLSVAVTTYYLNLLHLGDWQDRVMQAYFKEKPETAIWALENLVEVLEYHEKYAEGDEIQTIRTDQALTYARLAVVYDGIDDHAKYDEYMAKALPLARQALSDHPETESELLAIVARIDKNAAKRFESVNVYRALMSAEAAVGTAESPRVSPDSALSQT